MSHQHLGDAIPPVFSAMLKEPVGGFEMAAILSEASQHAMRRLAEVDSASASALAEALEDIGNRYLDMSEFIADALAHSRQAVG